MTHAWILFILDLDLIGYDLYIKYIHTHSHTYIYIYLFCVVYVAEMTLFIFEALFSPTFFYTYSLYHLSGCGDGSLSLGG